MHVVLKAEIQGEKRLFFMYISRGLGQFPQSFAEPHHLHNSSQFSTVMWWHQKVMSAAASAPVVMCRGLRQSSCSVSGGCLHEPHISKGGGDGQARNKVRSGPPVHE